jgi:hypothetical protein
MVDTTPEATFEGPLTVVMVPEEHAEKVAEYVASLTEDDAEVSGYTFTREVVGGGIGGGGLGAVEGTNCHVTGPKLKPNDFSCADGGVS